MQRFVIILIVCIVGCTGKSTDPESQGGSTKGNAGKPHRLTEKTVGGIVLQPRTVINEKLSLLIPQQFSIMDDEMLRLKYPSGRRPTLVFTNESGSVNIAINHTRDRMRQDQIGAFHKRMDGVFRNLYRSATWFHSGVTDINGREWLKLDFRMPAIDTEIRNIMLGTSLEDRLLIVSFNVTKELEHTWLASANAIVQSLQVSD